MTLKSFAVGFTSIENNFSIFCSGLHKQQVLENIIAGWDILGNIVKTIGTLAEKYTLQEVINVLKNLAQGCLCHQTSFFEKGCHHTGGFFWGCEGSFTSICARPLNLAHVTSPICKAN